MNVEGCSSNIYFLRFIGLEVKKPYPVVKIVLTSYYIKANRVNKSAKFFLIKPFNYSDAVRWKVRIRGY